MSTHHDGNDSSGDSDGPDDSSEGGARGDSDDITGSSGEGLATRATMPEHMKNRAPATRGGLAQDLDVVMGIDLPAGALGPFN